MIRIGVISDTHGRLDESLPEIFAGVAAIIHAGDIGGSEVIIRLEEIAPVFAVRGNNDPLTPLPEERFEVFDGHRIMIRHIFGELHQIKTRDKKRVEQLSPDVVIFGHSHRPYQNMLGTTLLFNPGSAGPRRFSLPRTVGMLSLTAFRIDPRIIRLDD